MGWLRHGVPLIILLPLALICGGCGGTASGPPPPPPPPPVADFSLSLSSNSISVAEGATSPAVSVTVNPIDGFSGSVQIVLGALPTGVTSNPVSPFSISSNASTSVVLGASTTAATGNFSIAVQGTSGGLSHSTNLALAIQSEGNSALPRTAYARTDATSAADDPFGEPHHRHIVYDSANKHVFVANRAMNRIEVFSTTSQARVAQISVPGASSADISADGATVWIGTGLEEIVAIDTSALRVKNRYVLAGVTPSLETNFNGPVEVLSLSSGRLMVRLRQRVSSEALLALWDPASNSLNDLTSTAPVLFQQGVGVLARSGDHSKVIAAANDSSGELAVFDSGGNVVTGPLTLGSGLISAVAANSDGSGFAALFAGSGGTQLLLLDASLKQVGSYVPAVVRGVAFSRDGKHLYASEASSAASFITVLDGKSGQVIGRVPDAAIQGITSEIEDADETQLLFGISNRGVSLVDASAPGNLSLTAPSFAVAPSIQPSEGSIAGGTSVSVAGQNFTSAAQLNFGMQSALNVTVPGPAQIQANSPASVTNGAVNVTTFFQNGWLAIAPDAFSYGPQILQVLPNAGTNAGGDIVQIYGYGFGSDPTKVAVRIGGASATVQNVQNVTNIVSSLGLDASYPFSLERITLQTPPGSSGKEDVFVSSAAGSTTLAKSFQYLHSVQSNQHPGFFRFLVYDQGRQQLYITNIDHVEDFSLGQNAFLAPFVPPGGEAPNIGLRGLALTPDGSHLIVADFSTQNVYLFDPVAKTGTTVFLGGAPGFANSGPALVAATSTQSVFVSLSGQSGSSGSCSICLAQMNLSVSPPTVQVAPQQEVSSFTGAPLVHGTGAGDQVFVAFGASAGGPLAVWNASAPNQFVTSSANSSSTDLGAASDGNMFAVQTRDATEIRAADLSLTSVPTSAELAQIPGRVQVPGLALHPTGALVYQPFLTGAPGSTGVKGGVDILDAHSGALRLRIFLPQQFMTDVDGLHGNFLATDENGQRLFAITSSDGTPQNAAITIVQLAAVPLGIGSISPSTVAASGGATITIRGSGFQSGAAVTLNGKTASVTFKDINTLLVLTPSLTPGSQQMAIMNPDGETVSLDAAFTAN
jgi:IPT/TIG domain